MGTRIVVFSGTTGSCSPSALNGSERLPSASTRTASISGRALNSAINSDDAPCTLPLPSGGMVLSVNTEAVTSEEITSPLAESLSNMAYGIDFETFRSRARPVVQRLVFNKVTNILLYQQAKQGASEQIDETLDRLAESEVNKFIAEHGGNYADAQKTLEKMGMDWQEFKDYQAHNRENRK